MEKHKIPTPSLLEVQNWMPWIITDPRGVQVALQESSNNLFEKRERYKAPEPSIHPWIEESAPIDRNARLDIYAEAYFLRILESMKSDFQIAAKILGEMSFQKLVADYLKKYYSKSANIGEIGRQFSDFVLTYDDLKDVEFLESLVKMEWLFIESFYASDTGHLSSEKLAEMSDSDWGTAQFLIAPNVQLIKSEWPLDIFSELVREDVELAAIELEISDEKYGFLISRQSGTVTIKKLSIPQFEVLELLKAGKDLISTLENVQSNFANLDISASIMNWFNDWVSAGIIYDVKKK